MQLVRQTGSELEPVPAAFTRPALFFAALTSSIKTGSYMSLGAITNRGPEPGWMLVDCLARQSHCNDNERIMSKKHRRQTVSAKHDERDDLTDWAAIGMIVIASSLLLWAPLLA